LANDGGGGENALQSGPFRKYLNVFMNPASGWRGILAQICGLAYRSIPLRYALDAPDDRAGAPGCTIHSAMSHF
jgi:hypothetical protein